MKKFAKASAAAWAAAIMLGLAGLAIAATTVDLGTADDFAILAGSGVTNTGPTTITGDIGTFPTTTETGFDSITLNGTNHVGDSVTQGAKDDLVTAYDNAAGQTPVTTVPTELGGTTKTAGIYDSASGTFGITGTLTLDAEGNADAVFIFKAASTLITASDSNVVLANGAQACHVFWQVGSSATLGTNSTFRGNILALTSATLTTGTSVEGRVLARNGAVTLDTNTVTRAVCASTTSDDSTTSNDSTTSSDNSTTADEDEDDEDEDVDIKVTKEASPSALHSGPGSVTFTYKVTNEGDVSLKDVSVKDDMCSPVVYVSGRKDEDGRLDKNEKWRYSCTKIVSATETNKVTAKGTARGETVHDHAKATVTVSSVPGLPNAGIGPEEWGSAPWNIDIPAGIFSTPFSFDLNLKKLTI